MKHVLTNLGSEPADVVISRDFQPETVTVEPGETLKVDHEADVDLRIEAPGTVEQKLEGGKS